MKQENLLGVDVSSGVGSSWEAGGAGGRRSPATEAQTTRYTLAAPPSR